MAAKTEAPEAQEAAGDVVFTAKHGVLFHGTDIRFARDQERTAAAPAAVFSFTAPDSATAQKVRDLAAAEPQWGITEVTP
ncbi:MAG TPA: hypothetical protein VHX15_15730 [Frankiaceae bacterium]|jgi:hypothetical protein|nr:hypothetical protein [Frankiaceae bacterium]